MDFLDIINKDGTLFLVLYFLTGFDQNLLTYFCCVYLSSRRDIGMRSVFFNSEGVISNEDNTVSSVTMVERNDAMYGVLSNKCLREKN